MKRFAVVKHDWKNQRRIPIHEMLGQYHWEALDEEHVLLLGALATSKVEYVDSHASVLLLPSIHSRRTIKEHADVRDKMSFFLTLGRIGIHDQHFVVDLAIAAHEAFGHKFALDD